MTQSSRLLGLAACAIAALSACGPAAVDPLLSLTPKPRTINNMGEVSTFTVTATDKEGKPGKGAVTLTSPSGSFKGGVDVTLGADGTATADFSCAASADATCTGGTVRVQAAWSSGGVDVTAATTVNVTGPLDAGMEGPDAGSRLDGGVFDGGMAGEYALSLTTAKTNLIAGATDSTDVVIRLFTNTSGMLPVAGAVTLSLSGGASFSATGPQASSTVMTSTTTGAATVTVYPGTAIGNFTLTASALDAAQSLTLRALNVQGISWKTDSTTINTLNIASTGIGNATQVYFEVRDTSNNPLEGVEVSFSVAPGSAAGCSVAPTRAVSNSAGLVRTTLSSGDSAGIATIRAAIEGVQEASSNTFNIVIGRPSDSRLQVTCSRKTLGALQSVQPPRTELTTQCEANYSDRNGVKPNFPVQVSWLTEAGTVDGNSTGGANNGIATTVFRTAGNLPVNTTPLTGEPNAAGANPRDGFVTVVAAMSGEEQFWDGSGASAGATNGRWDPGEWFVDLPEPFVDSNDNAVYDPGEPFIDTDRLDCTTGMNLGKNQRWDGPNGCWDTNTQIWAPTHIVYAGNLVGGQQNTTYVTVTPPLPALMPANASSSHFVMMSDVNFNRLSSDGIGASITVTSGSRGNVTISNPPSMGESFGGHTISYATIRATETSPGVFVDQGTCDFNIPDAGYPATRCLRTVKFPTWFSSPTAMTLTVNGASPQALLADGGIPGPTPSTFELRVGNGLQAAPSAMPFAISFE